MTDIEVKTSPVYEQSANAVVAQVNGQMVALDVSEGVCFGLNGSATAIWDRLDGTKSVETIVAELIELYDVDKDVCREETHALLTYLSDKHLIRPVDRF